MEMEEKFKRYVIIQYSGMYNMVMDAYKVMDLTRINLKDYCYIQEHYGELMKEYSNTYEEAVKTGKEMQKNIY